MPNMINSTTKDLIAGTRESSFFIGSTYSNGPQVSLVVDERITAQPTLNTINEVKPLKRQNTLLNSQGLLFEEDVVRERCFHMLPYDDKYFNEAVNPSKIIQLPKPARKSGPLGRVNKSGINVKHLPCLPRKFRKKTLPGLENTTSVSNNSSQTSVTFAHHEPDDEDIHHVPKKVHSNKTNARWDEYLLSILSKNTANWIVKHKVEADDPKKQKLGNLIREWHGSDIGSELIKDNASDVDSVVSMEQEVSAEKGKWRQRKERNLLERVRAETSHDLPTDPYSTENAASFYRLPAGIRREYKSKHKETDGAVNKLAVMCQVPRRVQQPPPTLRDHLSKGVGDKILDTRNQYEQEVLIGNRPTYQKDDLKIIMIQTSNKYEKQLQTGFPQKPDEWQKKPGTETAHKQHSDVQEVSSGKIRKGFRRWKDLPSLLDENAHVVGTQEELDDAVFARASDPAHKRKTRSNTSLVKILEEWRSKWFLNSRYADATEDDLLRDMVDLDPGIRLKAVLTLSRALEFNPADNSVQLQEDSAKSVLVPESLMKGLHILLNDEKDRVRTAVAITLFALKAPNDEAERILLKKIVCDNPVDRWAAVQCFAHHGVCDSRVVGALVDQLMTSEDAVRHEQATHLLALLSNDVNNTSLVYSMLAEHLNSSNWRHKVISCKTLPVLGGNINKDISNKLTYLMWFDWHKEVRKAAAQCLGRTGHGKEVHDDLLLRLTDPCEKIRVNAVSQLGYLGIMTAKLLPIFLTCFQDQHVLIREECCITCGNLCLKAEPVVDLLVEHAGYDPIWRVKALAIQSLGKIGVLDDSVRLCLLWALRYEIEAAVRAEACQSIIKLNIKDEETADILQDRYLVESSPIVQLVIIEALSMYGISPVEDMSTVARVKQEVRKLCAKNNISSQILRNERGDDRSENINRFLCQDRPATTVAIDHPDSTSPIPPTRASPEKLEKPRSPLKTPHGQPDAELEMIPEDGEDKESFYQSRPMTTSSFLSFMTTDSESELSDSTSAQEHSSPAQSSAKSDRKSAKSDRKSPKSERKSARSTQKSAKSDRNLKSSRSDREWTMKGERRLSKHERRMSEMGDQYKMLVSQDSRPSLTPFRARSSIAGSLFPSRSGRYTTSRTQKRTNLKFHYVMEQIDNFIGLDLSSVIGTLNETVGSAKPEILDGKIETISERYSVEDSNSEEDDRMDEFAQDLQESLQDIKTIEQSDDLKNIKEADDDIKEHTLQEASVPKEDVTEADIETDEFITEPAQKDDEASVLDIEDMNSKVVQELVVTDKD